MKILVFAHRLEVGGTQVNAIDLAAGLRDLHGYEVILFATPGPMVRLAEEKGLRFVPAPDSYRHPSPARMRALRDLVRQERPDVVHVWDWWQCLEAYYGVHLPMRVPLVATDMMMDLTRVLPKSPPTTFGTPEIVDKARRAGRRRVEALLPPVDVHANSGASVDPGPFRERLEIHDGDITVVTVSRLATWMKSESLVRTTHAIRELGADLPLRFVIVGDGAAREQLEALAGETNDALGRKAVMLTGALLDPRPAYAASDIVVGMGGSSLRGLSFGKPVVVVGEKGFAAPFNPETADSFLYRGMYGIGEGQPGNENLVSALRSFAEDEAYRHSIGAFSRQFVKDHFSLETLCRQFDALCREAISDIPSRRVTTLDALRTAAVYLRERRFLTPSRDKVPVDRIVEEGAR